MSKCNCNYNGYLTTKKNHVVALINLNHKLVQEVLLDQLVFQVLLVLQVRLVTLVLREILVVREFQEIDTTLIH